MPSIISGLSNNSLENILKKKYERIYTYEELIAAKDTNLFKDSENTRGNPRDRAEMRIDNLVGDIDLSHILKAQKKEKELKEEYERISQRAEAYAPWEDEPIIDTKKLWGDI